MINKGGILEIRLSALDVVPGEIPEKQGLRPGGWVKLSITDTGYGMSPEMQERIFEPYFSTKEKGLGTGLGLAVVHGIVQSYDGLIDLYSKVGEGTKFTVYLPRLDKIIEETPSTPEPLPMGNNERILFVDDEAMLIDFGKDALEQLNYKVIPVSQPEEALNIFRARPHDFDLVITDMTMPKMTGDLLATEILQIRPDIPIILCTGFSETITKEKALAGGIRDFLMKPINIQELAETIYNVLNS